MHRFFTTNYKEIVKMAEKITQHPDHEEIAHYIMEQFMEHPRRDELIEKGEAMQFMSGMIWRNYHSSTSPFHKLYRQSGRVFNRPEIDDNREQEEYDRELDIKLSAIEGILEDMQAEGLHTWYLATLFQMWIEVPNYSEMSRQTLIPRTSIAQAVEEAREYILNRLRENGIID